MASTYTTNTGIEKIGNGEKAGAWGTTTNTNFDIIDRASSGYKKITLGGNTHTLDTTDGSLTSESSSTSDARYVVYEFETGSATGAVTVTINDNDRSFLYLIKNDTNQTITFTYGSGTTADVVASETAFIFGNGDSSGPVIAKYNPGNVTGNLTVSGDASVGDDLSLTSDSAVLNFGADSEVKVTHVADTGLNIKHTATADDKPIVLTLQTGETDIQANDVIGAINFQAPDEGTGTDAILVAAGIEAVSEGDFAADSNATKLSFKTGSSEAASEKMSLSSAGNLVISGDLTVSGDDITMGTNTSGHIMVADGTNFNPVAVSGDVTIASTGAVTIANDAVETDMIADSQVTQAKLASGVGGKVQQIVQANASGSKRLSTSFATTNLTRNITVATTNNDVLIQLNVFTDTRSSVSEGRAVFKMFRGSTDLGYVGAYSSESSRNCATVAMQFLDTNVPAGTHTYTLHAKSETGTVDLHSSDKFSFSTKSFITLTEIAQ